jgi:hypothetical protein
MQVATAASEPRQPQPLPPRTRTLPTMQPPRRTLMPTCTRCEAQQLVQLCQCIMLLWMQSGWKPPLHRTLFAGTGSSPRSSCTAMDLSRIVVLISLKLYELEYQR